MKIILIGAPGSGKGTLSEYLVQNHNFKHLSTGNIFRKIIDNKDKYCDELQSYINKGELVPDKLTNEIVKYELSKYKEKDSYILDGYPRTIDQANFLDSIAKIDKVIYLHVDEDILEKRLVGRRMCSQCKKIYNIYFDPPKVENMCDNDQSMLIQRKDDDASVINDRLENYKKNTFPLISYYDSKKILIGVDGKN